MPEKFDKSEFEKIQKMQDHEDYVNDVMYNPDNPSNPNKKEDPLYDELKEKEKEIWERANQPRGPLTDVGQASMMGPPEDTGNQEGEESTGSSMEEILSEQKFNEDRDITIDGKKIKSHKKYVEEQDLKRFDTED